MQFLVLRALNLLDLNSKNKNNIKTIVMKRKEKFKKLLFVALLFLLPSISMSSKTVNIKQSYNMEYISTNSPHKIKIEKELKTEVKNYIIKFYPNCPDEIPEKIVEAGLFEDIDICFMMAQAQIETCYGKNGKGRVSSRHSLFGVEYKRYSCYRDAIYEYVRLLKKSYLVNGKTEQNLMRRYVNKSGNRYAANPRYEAELTAAYKTIISKTAISQLQQQYRQL